MAGHGLTPLLLLLNLWYNFWAAFCPQQPFGLRGNDLLIVFVPHDCLRGRQKLLDCMNKVTAARITSDTQTICSSLAQSYPSLFQMDPSLLPQTLWSTPDRQRHFRSFQTALLAAAFKCAIWSLATVDYSVPSAADHYILWWLCSSGVARQLKGTASITCSSHQGQTSNPVGGCCGAPPDFSLVLSPSICLHLPLSSTLPPSLVYLLLCVCLFLTYAFLFPVAEI